MQMNPAMKILMENAKTFADRNKISALMESELKAVNNTMVSNLYNSAISKAHVDFDDIPHSKGDITKYSGYKSMMEILTLVREIASKHSVKIPEVDVVTTAISNIAVYRESFEKGFRLDKEFVILQYNTLVYACIEATSVIVSSYVDFVKRPDRNEFTIIQNTRRGGHASIQNLERFNQAVKQGEFSKVLNSVINSGKEALIGVDDLVVPTIILGGVLVIVPLIRELIFSFYYSRMKISDYLKHQAMLLEINKENLESVKMSAKERNAIVKKQTQQIEKLRRLSDAIKVDSTMSDNKATIEMGKENKHWTIDEVKTQSAGSDTNGFQLL